MIGLGYLTAGYLLDRVGVNKTYTLLHTFSLSFVLYIHAASIFFLSNIKHALLVLLEYHFVL